MNEIIFLVVAQQVKAAFMTGIIGAKDLVSSLMAFLTFVGFNIGELREGIGFVFCGGAEAEGVADSEVCGFVDAF